MNKIKFAKRNGVPCYIVKSDKGQQISEREAYAIQNNCINGVLHFELEANKRNFNLIYNISGFITLREFLQTSFNKEKFAELLQNILNVLKALDDEYFNFDGLLLDLNYVMVNPATNNLYFMYIPIQGFTHENSLRNFLLSIIQFCSFVPDEDSSYVQKYIAILNSGINFSLFELEEYVKELTRDDNKPMQFVLCPKCHQNISTEDSYCTFCGFKMHGYTGECRKEKTYDPMNADTTATKTAPTETQHKDGNEKNKKKKKTVVLGYDKEQTESSAYLIRKKTQEKISVDQNDFTIGQESMGCRYCIADNPAVSRSHATIYIRAERFLLVDEGSTNGTFVDGKRIPAHNEIELFSGTEIRFANEDYVFYYE